MTKVIADGISKYNPGISVFGGHFKNLVGGSISSFAGSCGHFTNISDEHRAIFYGL